MAAVWQTFVNACMYSLCYSHACMEDSYILAILAASYLPSYYNSIMHATHK